MDQERGRKLLFAAARKLETPSARLGTAAGQLLSTTLKSDGELRSIVEEIREIGSPEVVEQINSVIATMKLPPELLASLATLNDLVSLLKSMSVLNLSLRKALRPGIQGIEDIRQAFSILMSWEQLGGSA